MCKWLAAYTEYFYASPNASVMITLVRHAAKHSRWSKHICDVDIAHVPVQTTTVITGDMASTQSEVTFS